MSHATEWAESVRQAEAALTQRRMEKPESFALKVGDTVLTFSVTDHGLAQVQNEGAPLGVETGRLLDLAAWIDLTFQDEPPPRDPAG